MFSGIPYFIYKSQRANFRIIMGKSKAIEHKQK